MSSARPPIGNGNGPVPDDPHLAAASPATAPEDVAVRIADDFGPEEIGDRLSVSKRLLTDLQAQWPGLASLVADDRNGNLGKLVARIGPPLRLLLGALTPVPGEDPVRAQSKKSLHSVFSAALGNADQGHDPQTFEVDLLANRLMRVEAEQAIVTALDVVRKRFSDDLLNTGEMVVTPGLQALTLARGLLNTSPEFHSLLAPVIDALGDLTKEARANQSHARNLESQLEKAKTAEAKTAIKANTKVVKAKHAKAALAAELEALKGPPPTPDPTKPPSQT